MGIFKMSSEVKMPIRDAIVTSEGAMKSRRSNE